MGYNQYRWLFYLSIIFTICIRLPFVFIPFTIGDEAELMTFGTQLLKGSIYGLDVVDTRGPGGFYIAGIISYLFGFGNTIAYHIIGITFQIIIIVLIYLLARYLYDKNVACIATFIYSVFSYAYILHDTLGFNVEVMAMPFLLSSTIFLYKGINSIGNGSPSKLKWLYILLTGILCAIVFSIKQVICSCLIVYLIYIIILWYKGFLKNKYAILILSLLIYGFLIGFFIIFWKNIATLGLKDIVYWLAIYGAKHYISWPSKLLLFSQRVLLLFIAQPLLWCLSILWIIKYSHGFNNNKITRPSDLILLLLLFQYGGLIIAGQVVGHYFIPAISIMSIMAACVIEDMLRYIIVDRKILMMLIILGIMPPVFNYTIFPEGVQTGDYSIKQYINEKIYIKDDPITKAVSYIIENAQYNDDILVLGTLYEIYPLSKRLPSTIGFGVNWFLDRKNDNILNGAYSRIIDSFNSHPPKLIIIPCAIYGGIDLSKGWDDIADIIRKKYRKVVRFDWKSRLKFLRGKGQMNENSIEWIDIYTLVK